MSAGGSPCHSVLSRDIPIHHMCKVRGHDVTRLCQRQAAEMLPRRWPNGSKLLVALWDWQSDTGPIAQMKIKTDLSKAIRGQKGPGDTERAVGWTWGGRWMNWWTDHWTQQTKTDGGRGRAWKANASADASHRLRLSTIILMNRQEHSDTCLHDMWQIPLRDAAARLFLRILRQAAAADNRI